MRSRGSYKITSTEEGKTAQLDQSYKSCLMALIIFLFLCIILILACLLAQKSGKDYQSTIAMSQTDSDNNSTEKFKTVLIPDADIEPPRDSEDYSEENPESSPFPSEIPSSTEKYTTKTEQINFTVTSSTKHFFVNTVQPILSQKTTSSSTDNYTNSTSEAQDSTAEEITSIPQITTEQKMFESSNSTSEENVKINWQLNSTETISSASSEMTSGTSGIFLNDYSTLSTQEISDLTENLQTSSSTASTRDQENFENDYSTLANNLGTSESVSNQLQLTSTETFTVENKEATTTDDDMSSILVTGNFSLGEEQTASLPMKTQTKLRELLENVYKGKNITEDFTATETVISQRNSTPNPSNSSSCTFKKACENKGCKQVASKMLSFMNHWGNACVDFYEYACGNLEADYQISDKDLSRRAYEIIKRQAEKKSNLFKSAKFNRYYDSCINYEVNFNISERIKLAKEVLEKVGKFRTRSEWENGHASKDLNEIFAKILQNDWPLLFDIVPDVNKTNPEIFTLTIGPRPLVFDDKPFQLRNDPNQCEHEDEMLSDGLIDFDFLYGKYVNCKKNTKRFMDSINQTLSAFHIFDILQDDGNRSQSIELTINAIDLDIIRGILKKYSSDNEIHEAYRSKNYTIMTLDDLQGDRKSINWTQLIGSLTQSDFGKDTKLYVYNENELIEALNELELLWINRPYDLNNALLGLYAQYLYNKFVAPKSLKDLHNHCLYKAVNSMKDVASELYMESLTESEIERMNKVMEKHFDALMETLRQNIKKIKWATELEQKRLLEKLDNTKMSLPERLEEIEAKLDINDNYFGNSMKLMNKYRNVMYSMIKKKPLNEIWRFFASPFDSKAQTIYALNLTVIPYGAVEVDMKTSTIMEKSISYLTLATIGNIIARQIAQNFDITALRYWNVFTDDRTKDTYENEYISCHQSLYEDNTIMSWTVTGKSLNVHFKVPILSLNERLSDIVGLKLARDTLDRLDLNSTLPLPWSNLNVIQLFYLTYVQAHCTKTPLSSLYVSLNEDPFLPSRIRVYVASNNNGLFDKEWNCPLSTSAPPSECRAFPHLDNDE